MLAFCLSLSPRAILHVPVSLCLNESLSSYVHSSSSLPFPSSLLRFPTMKIRKPRPSLLAHHRPLPFTCIVQKLSSLDSLSSRASHALFHIKSSNVTKHRPSFLSPHACDATFSLDFCSADHQQVVGVEPEQKDVKLRRSASVTLGSRGDGGKPGYPQDHGVPETLAPKRRKVKSGQYSGKLHKPSADSSGVENHAKSVHKWPRDRTEENGTDHTPNFVNAVATSKEALISSIFFVFDTLGKNGLTASEVVDIMLDQDLPGLKEGGARHTVQVANVLRSSPYFLSIGNKRYLPCSSLEERPGPKNQTYKEGGLLEEGPHGDGSEHHGRQGQGNTKSVPKVVHVEQENVRRRGPVGSQQRKGHAHCKVYDGSGWQCTQQSQPGSSLCEYHLDVINKSTTKPRETKSISKSFDDSLHVHVRSQESDSEGDDIQDIRGSHTKWNRDRARDAPIQKRKMLSLMSIK